MRELKSPLLHRYWFPATLGFGVGVTAFSLEEAHQLASHARQFLLAGAVLGEPLVNIDVSTLDELHVIPNIGACNFRGIWYPNIGHQPSRT